jgi:hypothetical protein
MLVENKPVSDGPPHGWKAELAQHERKARVETTVLLKLVADARRMSETLVRDAANAKRSLHPRDARALHERLSRTLDCLLRAADNDIDRINDETVRRMAERALKMRTHDQ